jgi:DNA-binding transcriptional ArsR family regulator
MPAAPANRDHQIFRAISDPARRAILDHLARNGPTPALQLGTHFHGSQPALSKHLRVLRSARLVRTRRVGRQHLYTIHAAPLETVERWISLYRAFWSTRLDALARHLDQQP